MGETFSKVTYSRREFLKKAAEGAGLLPLAFLMGPAQAPVTPASEVPQESTAAIEQPKGKENDYDENWDFSGPSLPLNSQTGNIDIDEAGQLVIEKKTEDSSSGN